MKMSKNNTVAFTGHRSFKVGTGQGDLFGGAAGDSLAESLERAIIRTYGEGFRYFMSGMAEGFDLMAAEAVLGLKGKCEGIQLLAVIPFAGQAKTFGREAAERYGEILSSADRIITVCENYAPDSYHRRNDYLIEKSSVLISYYNGSKGGTEYTVKKALKSGLRIINLY